MSEEEISSLREKARKQYQTEEADQKLKMVMADLVDDILKTVRGSDDVGEKRKALKQVRMAKKQMAEDRQEMRRLSESSAEELIDELTGLLKEKEAERDQATN